MNHEHHYSFWHAHGHWHRVTAEDIYHDQGHHHIWQQIHDHGTGIMSPHTHKAKQYHPEEVDEQGHHHGVKDHKEE